jgi:hypothetical protein
MWMKHVRSLTILVTLAVSVTTQAAITGTIVDPNGNPIGGATVRAYAAEDSAGMWARIIAGKLDREPLATAQSAPNGTFSIEVKGLSDIDIAVTTDDYRRIFSTVDGEDLGAIVLGLLPAQNVRVTSGGQPVKGAVFVVGPYFWRSDAEGLVKAFQGPWVVIHPDFAIAHSDGSGASDIKLTRGIGLRGRVVDAAGPVAHAVISLDGVPLTESAGDGGFTIAHAPGNWQLITAVHGNEIGEAARGTAPSTEIRMHAGMTLTGTVHELTHGAPVSGARMTLTGVDGMSMVTSSDSRGRFSFEPLLARTYRVAGLHPTYAIEPSSVTVDGSRSRDFAAQPFAAVHGHVIDDENKPMAGVIVSSNDRYVRAVATNAAGEFALRFASSTTPSAIVASKPGYGNALSKPRVWQPGDAREDIVLKLGRRFLVQVQVVDQQGQPVPDAEVNAARLGDGVRSIVSCRSEIRVDCHHAGADGIVTLSTTEGPHDLEVSGDDIAPLRLSHQLLNARSQTIVVKVDRGIEIRGRVIHADGTPAAGAIVEMPTVLQPRSVPAAADGSFRLIGVPAGAGVVAAFSSDRQIASGDVVVNAPATGVTITIPRGGRLQGRVIDRVTQKPVQDFTVLIPTHNGAGSGLPLYDGWRIHADDGRYSIDYAPSGSLEIIIRAAGYAEGSRKGITVEDGKTITGIDIQLNRASQVTGRVTAAGKPLAGVQVLLDPSPLKSDAIQVNTDDQGTFAFDGVGEGVHNIAFYRSGFVVVNKPVMVTLGNAVHLDVALDNGQELQGRVVDRSGRGVSNVSVFAMQGPGNTVTDGEGAFVLRGLAEGHYQIGAKKAGYVTGETPFDLPQTQPLVFTLDRGATVSGRITGLSSEQFGQVTVTGQGGNSLTRTTVDDRGDFAIPGMPEGNVRIDASLSWPGQSRTAPSKTILVQNGLAPLVDLSFAEEITVRGRVSRNGGPPPPNGSILFLPLSSGQQATGATIASDGQYKVSGLVAGVYDVQVSGPGFGFKTKYTATANATFDLEIHGASLKGRTIDWSTGAPVSNVHVLLSGSQGLPVGSDSSGRFAFDGLADGTYELTASRQDYASAVEHFVVANGAVSDFELRMEKVPATIIHVVDSNSGAPVKADLTIISTTSSLVNMATQVDAGTFKVWVRPGAYTVFVHAADFSRKQMDITVPTSDITISLAR